VQPTINGKMYSCKIRRATVLLYAFFEINLRHFETTLVNGYNVRNVNIIEFA